MKPGKFCQHGLTLPEILMSLVGISLFLGGLYPFLLTTSRTYSTERLVAQMLQHATDAMERISRDVRGAGTFWASPCILEPLVTASNSPPGRITIRQILDDPSVRTTVPPPPPAGQSQTSAVLRVESTVGFQVGNLAFITDGVQCSRFTVTQVIGGANPGLQHDPAADLNSPGGFGYLYPASISQVFKLSTDRRITYAIDLTDPNQPWLTRDDGTGPIRLIPDIERLQVTFTMQDGTTVTDPSTITTAAQTANIRMVTITLTARTPSRDPTAGGDGYRRQTLNSRIQLRNLGS